MVGRKILIIILLCLVTGSGIYVWIHRGKSDSEIIKENLRSLETLISVTPGEVRRPFLAKIQVVKRLFAAPCTLDLDEGGLTGRYPPQKITALITRFQAHVVWARLMFLDIKIHFPGKRTAAIHCTGHLKGMTRSSEKIDEFRELEIEMSKTGGKWFFTRFRTIEALEK